MKALTVSQCRCWLTERDFRLEAAGFPPRPHGRFTRVFSIPTEDEARHKLAETLEKLSTGSEVLLWLADWPFYAEEEMNQFLRLRWERGEYRELICARGHLFDRSECTSGRSVVEFLFLMFKFNWEGHLIRGDHKMNAWMADEIIEISTADSSLDDILRRSLQELGIALRLL